MRKVFLIIVLFFLANLCICFYYLYNYIAHPIPYDDTGGILYMILGAVFLYSLILLIVASLLRMQNNKSIYLHGMIIGLMSIPLVLFLVLKIKYS